MLKSCVYDRGFRVQLKVKGPVCTFIRIYWYKMEYKVLMHVLSYIKSLKLNNCLFS